MEVVGFGVGWGLADALHRCVKCEINRNELTWFVKPFSSPGFKDIDRDFIQKASSSDASKAASTSERYFP